MELFPDEEVIIEQFDSLKTQYKQNKKFKPQILTCAKKLQALISSELEKCLAELENTIENGINQDCELYDELKKKAGNLKAVERVLNVV